MNDVTLEDYKSALSGIFGALLGGWLHKNMDAPDVAERVQREAGMFIDSIATAMRLHPHVVDHLRLTVDTFVSSFDVFIPAMREGMFGLHEDQKEMYNSALVAAKKCAAQIEKRRKQP